VRGLTQSDDLLFLACLVLAFRLIRALAPLLAVFAMAQMCGMICCAAGLASTSPGLGAVTATLAAAVVVYMGIEAIIAVESEASESHRTCWLVAVASGLIFGSNFWLVLDPIVQFGGIHRSFSILAFNFGLAASQLGVISLIVAAMPFALRIPRAPRIAVVTAAAIAVHISWHRMIDRAHALGTIATSWPFTGSKVFAISGSALAVVLVVAAVRTYSGENKFSWRAFR
jgi:hypothetical protein